jgi:hypothetical protein
MADTLARLALVVDSSSAVAGYRAATTAAQQTAQAELQLARAAEASARASQAGIASTAAAAQANVAGARATLQLAQAQQGASSAAAQAAQATLLNARASASAAQASVAQARAVTQAAAATTAQAQATVQAARVTTTHGQATVAAGQSAKGAGIDFGNLGAQIQDMAVQASSGTSALIILAQQGPQIASAFGPVGVAVGAAIAIAAAAAIGFGVMGSAQEKAAKAAELQKSKTEDLLSTLGIAKNNVDQLTAAFDLLTKAQQGAVTANIQAGFDRATEEADAARKQVEQLSTVGALFGSGSGFFSGGGLASAQSGLSGLGEATQIQEVVNAYKAGDATIQQVEHTTRRLAEAQGQNAREVEARVAAVRLLATNLAATAEREAEARYAVHALTGTLDDQDRAWKANQDSIKKTQDAVTAYQNTIENLDQRLQGLKLGTNKREQFIQEQIRTSPVGDIADPKERAEKTQAIREKADAIFTGQEEVARNEKRADVAARLSIAEKELTFSTDARRRAGEEAYATTLAQTEGDTVLAERAKRLTLAKVDQTKAIEASNSAATKARGVADRRSQFETGLDLEQDQMLALKGAIDQGSDAYERQANVLEVMRRVRAAGFDLSTREGQEVLARAAGIRDETEALQRQAAVRKDLDTIIRRATAAPGLSATGQELDLPQLVGLTPQAIDEVVARAEFVRAQIEKLGDQRDPAVVADTATRANQAFDLRKTADDGTKGARATAQLNQEAEQQKGLASVIRGTAAARLEMENRIAAENKALSILGTTTTQQAKDLIAADMANRERAQGIESATQLTLEYASATDVLRDRLAQIARDEAQGGDPTAAARAKRAALRQGVREQAEEFEETDDPFKGVQAGLLRLQDQTGTLAETISGQLSSSLDEGVNGFTELLMAGDLTWNSLGEGLERFAADMTSSIAKMLIMQAVLRTIGGTTGGTAGGGTGLLGAFFGGQAHQGGVVGEGGARRMVDPMWFATAPRYHAGGLVLGRDEVPIIAQRGERVQSRQEVASQRGGGTKIEVYDQRGKDAPPIEQERGRDGNGMETIKLMIRREQNENVASGGLDRTLQSRFKVARVLR